VTLLVVARHLRPPATLVVRARVNVVSGATAQAVGAAQGRVLQSLLATLSAPGPTDLMEIEKVDGVPTQTDETR
jgi:hypothetical protein